VIVVYHNNQRVLRALYNESPLEVFDLSAPICAVITALSLQFPDAVLVWCNEEVSDELELSAVLNLLQLPQEIISFQPSYGGYFGPNIEWVEESIFVSVPKNTRYATWMLSSCVGAMHASLWMQLAPHINPNDTFAYTLHSLGKRAQSTGLFCYSEPALLHTTLNKNFTSAAQIELYRFVKQHYKSLWVWILFWQQLRYQSQYNVLPLLRSWFVVRLKPIALSISAHPLNNTDQLAISVLIPTLNRPQYLADFLADLQAQTLLPKEVIIIEQQPDQNSESQLTALLARDWKFQLKHLFIHQLGVCHARNLGLAQVTGDWVFFADDDIRIAPTFLAESATKINQTNAQAVSFACLSPTQKSVEKPVIQWNAFGGGSSLVSKSALKECQFSMVFEHGFGEDLDFGMQLRSIGTDVLFFSTPAITHLKAPAGGFRLPKKLAWQSDSIQPKPAPTVMAYIQKYYTAPQRKTYKLMLLLKYYSKQSLKNPIRYYRRFEQQWKQSVYWASKLDQLP
jgi:glycosyltransferase involved in cell wall biosynthesis